MDELTPEDRQVLISDVLTQLDELTALVADLAELARGDQPALETGPFRFDSVVMEAVGVATTHGRPRGVVFEAHVAPTWVHGSASRIERAVDNLLDNALKWSPDGGVVEVLCANGALWFAITGPVSTRVTSPTSSIASTAPPAPAAVRDRGWAWPSWPRWSERKGAR